MTYLSSSPPAVTQVNPAGPGIGDPVGAARTFTASCTQLATMRVYLNGNLVHTSAPSVQQVSYTFPSAPLGQQRVRVTATNAKGSGENYWTWSVFVTPPEITQIDPAEPEVTDRTNRSCGTALRFAALCTGEALRCCLFFRKNRNNRAAYATSADRYAYRSG